MIEVKAPNEPNLPKRIFLAGSIEQGKARDWQKDVAAALSDLDVIILNPKRDEWDASWEQTVENTQFYEQVTWELDMLEAADIIALYFQEDTLSPISLLEFGLFARSGKLTVYCPDGFWRKGNVDMVCNRYSVWDFNDYDAWLEELKYQCGN